MISKNTINSAALALPLLNKEYVASRGTPLDVATLPEIERLSFVMSGFDKPGGVSFTVDDIAETMKESTENELGGYDPRNLVISELSEAISNVVFNNIYVARSVVLPLIDEYTEVLNNIVGENLNVNNLALRIVVGKQFDILSNPVLLSMVEKFSKYSGGDTTVSAHSNLITDELRTLILTGNDRVDSVIENWFETTTVDLNSILRKTYNAVFYSGVKKPLTEVFAVEGFESAIFTLLLAINFQRNTPEGVNMNLDNYNTALEKTIATASKFIYNSIAKYQSDIKLGKLVYRYPVRGLEYAFDSTFSGKTDILVNGIVYEEFLNKGGSPEVLLGAYLNDRETTLVKILDKKDQYLSAFNRASSTGKLTKGNTVLSIVRNTIINISQRVQSDIDAKMEAQNNSTQFRSIDFNYNTFGKEVAEFNRKLTIHDCDNLYTLVRRFICDIYFKETNILDLLKRIDKLDKEGVGNIDEIALLASIDFIGEWLAGQIKVASAEDRLDY